MLEKLQLMNHALAQVIDGFERKRHNERYRHKIIQTVVVEIDAKFTTPGKDHPKSNDRQYGEW